jgi:hypothetical protein
MNNEVLNEKSVAELFPTGGEITFLMPSTNMIGMLKDAKPQQTLTAKYMTVEDWQKEQGIEKRCIYLGMKSATDASGDQYFLAKFTDGKSPFVCAQTVIVQSFATVPVGQAVSITCTEVVKNSKNGKTALFEISDLGFNAFDKNE